MAPRQEAANEKPGAPDNFPEDRMEVGGQESISVDSPIEIPDSQPLSAQLPSASSPFGEICVPAQAPALDPGCLDHVSYDQ